MSNPKVSIVILNWNGWQDTLECFESLKKITYPNYEVVIVDNNSTNESVEKIKNWISDKKSATAYKLLINGCNAGFAGGNNQGIKYAIKNKSDYILLLNNDTIVEFGFLEKLVEIGESDQKNGIIGPKIYYENDKKRIWFGGGKINWLKTQGIHLDLNKEDIDEVKNINNGRDFFMVDYITGCAMLIKKEVIKKIGLLSEDYFLYYEDTDYCLRALKAGWQSVLTPKSNIWHKVSRSTKEFSPSYLYYHARNELMLSRKTNGAAKVFLVYILSFCLAIKQIIKYLFCPTKREWAKIFLAGILDFWKGKTGKLDN